MSTRVIRHQHGGDRVADAGPSCSRWPRASASVRLQAQRRTASARSRTPPLHRRSRRKQRSRHARGPRCGAQPRRRTTSRGPSSADRRLVSDVDPVELHPRDRQQQAVGDVPHRRRKRIAHERRVDAERQDQQRGRRVKDVDHRSPPRSGAARRLPPRGRAPWDGPAALMARGARRGARRARSAGPRPRSTTARAARSR